MIKIITKPKYSSWDINDWTYDMRFVFSNNSAGNSTLTLLHLWDAQVQTWKNQDRMFNTYDGTKLAFVHDEYWDYIKWVPSYNVSYSYDSLNRQVICLSQMYDPNNLVNTQKVSSTYSSTGYTELLQTWRVADSAWANSSKYEYEYAELATSVPENSEDVFFVYPVPATDLITISGKGERRDISIFDANGKFIGRKSGEGEITFDLSAYPGWYLFFA